MGPGIMDVLSVPMMIVTILYVIGTVVDTLSSSELKKYLNVDVLQSTALKWVFGGFTILIVASFYAGATIDNPEDLTEDMLVVQFARVGLYMAMAASWYWLYESYKNGYMKKWFSKIKITK